MRNSLLAVLLALCCLSAHGQGIRPLRPLVVSLDSGTTVQRRLIGLDPSAYQAVRLGQASDERLLLVRAARIRGLVAGRRADSLDYVALGRELRATRLDLAGLSAELTKSEVRNQQLLRQPLQRPLLLSGHFYAGLGAGALAALLLLVLHP